MFEVPGRETLRLRERVAEIADDTGPGVRGAGIDQGTARGSTSSHLGEGQRQYPSFRSRGNAIHHYQGNDQFSGVLVSFEITTAVR